MAYLKFSATKLFDGRTFLPDKTVVITKDDGTIDALLPAEEAGDDVRHVNGILAPGLINCHCHLELSHMKGMIPEHTGLVDFVLAIVTGRHLPEEEVLQAIIDGESEMRRNGIVAVGDICNNPLTIATKQQRRLHYYNFIEASGWLPGIADARMQRVMDLYLQFESIAPGSCAIVPHAPYSVSADLWQLIRPWFNDRIVSIHNQEAEAEETFFREGKGDLTRMYELMKIDNSHHQPTGYTSLRSYYQWLNGAQSALLVHNTFTTAADIEYVKEHQGPNTWFCLCANANRYIENRMPPIDLLRSQQCGIVLGTDSLASNWSLSILDEMRTIRDYIPDIPLEELLTWATSNGAKALKMDETLGSIAVGKQPGLVFLDENLSFIERLV